MSPNDFKPHYRLDGPDSAPVLVLGHSIGTSSALFDAQLDDLGTSFRLLRIDFRGHGLSSAPPGPYSIELLGGDVLSLLDELGIASFDYAGVSLGGMVGQWLGARVASRVRRLVLANTAAQVGTREHWDSRMAGVAQHGLESIVDAAMLRWFSPALIANEPARVDAFKKILVGTSLDGYIATCVALRDADHRELVGEIACPTLVIAGALDQVTTPADGVWLAEHIPGARLEIVPASHLSNVEAPAEFNSAVRRFLAAGD